MFQLSRLKHFVNFRTRKLFFTSHIQSLIDYRSTLWDSTSKSTLKPLQSLHRWALKLILLKQSPLEQDDNNLLNILPLHTRLKYNKGIYMKKIMVGNAPSSLRYLLPINPTCDQIKINIPSLTFSGASLWNSLTLSLKTQSSKLFKKHYLSYLTNLPWFGEWSFDIMMIHLLYLCIVLWLFAPLLFHFYVLILSLSVSPPHSLSFLLLLIVVIIFFHS